mmetsp:Transcript_78225/g.252961  ORF Transcript_78225/g.252961 Transcript_78225/m.252961 type:complete len:189 (-) Transcript_78225:463-1029(-)
MRWASPTMKSLHDDLSSLGAKTGRESLVSSEPSTEPGVSSAVTVKLDISTCCAPMEGTSHAACTLPKGGHLAINSGILAFGEPWRFGGGEVDLDGLLFDLKHSATAGSVGTLKFNSMLQFGQGVVKPTLHELWWRRPSRQVGNLSLLLRQASSKSTRWILRSVGFHPWMADLRSMLVWGTLFRGWSTI